jgi:hypothetical protein
MPIYLNFKGGISAQFECKSQTTFEVKILIQCHVKWLSEGWYICHNKQMQLWHVTFATYSIYSKLRNYNCSAISCVGRKYLIRQATFHLRPVSVAITLCIS